MEIYHEMKQAVHFVPQLLEAIIHSCQYFFFLMLDGIQPLIDFVELANDGGIVSLRAPLAGRRGKRFPFLCCPFKKTTFADS